MMQHLTGSACAYVLVCLCVFCVYVCLYVWNTPPVHYPPFPLYLPLPPWSRTRKGDFLWKLRFRGGQMTLTFYKERTPDGKLVNDKPWGWAGGRRSRWLA